MKTLMATMQKAGFSIMMAGFILAMCSVLFFVLYLNKHDPAGTYKPISLAVSLIGFGIYILGRILVSMQRRTERQARLRKAAEQESKDDDE